LVVRAAGGEVPDAVVVVLKGEADLLEVVGALHSGGGFTHLLDGGEQQADQDGDDGDHDEQFDQREGALPPTCQESCHDLSPKKETNDDGRSAVPKPR